MKHQYRMYGLLGSHFAAKLRGYINYKGLDYEEKNTSAYDLLVRLPKAIGATAMPALECNTGEWLADTPLIIEELEKRHPERTIAVDTPIQSMAAQLLESWFDDSWIQVSVHTRWSYPENWDELLEREWGKALLPRAPGFFADWFAGRMVKRPLSASRHALGVRPDVLELLERWALGHLDTLDQHFAQNDYLFGGRPTIADYACVAPMAPHLNRDPWPKREWLDPRPDLQAWVERTHGGDPARGELAPDDEIPDTLLPLFSAIFKEFSVYVDKTVEGLADLVARKSLGPGDSLPRALRDVSYPMLDGEYTRMPLTYTIWRMQRMQRMFQALPADQQERVKQWCAQMGRADMFTMDLGPALKRDALSAALA